jgi:hypothetical protein
MSQDNPLTVQTEIEWTELFDEVSDLVDVGKLPPKALEAIPYLMSGLPKSEVAKLVKVTRPTINNWLNKHPAMQIAVARGKEMAQSYRLAMLESQFVKALQVSQEILDMPMTGSSEEMGEDAPVELQINSKIATAKGQHARFIIDKFISSKREIEVTHELGQTVLDAQNDALSYLATQINELSDEEDIPVTYRVIDANPNNEGPRIQQDGSPNFGTLGGLTHDDELGTQCHDCGNWFKSLATHIRRTMSMSVTEYEKIYQLEHGSVVRISP